MYEGVCIYLKTCCVDFILLFNSLINAHCKYLCNIHEVKSLHVMLGYEMYWIVAPWMKISGK